MICINLLVLCNVDLDQKWGDYTRVFSLMQSLLKKGHKIFVMIIRPETNKPRILYLKEGDIDVIQIHPPSLGLKGKRGISRHLKYLSCIPKISSEATKIIKKYGIDYIYAYMPGTGSSVPAIRIKSKHKIPLVLDLADMYSMIRPKLIVKKSFNEADKIIVITNYLRNDLIKKGIPDSKIHVIPNGVDFDFFNQETMNKEKIKKIRQELGSEKLIVFSGSLQDLNIIIDSAKHVIEKIPTVKFVIIGDHRDPNRSKSAWESRIHEKKLDDHFILLGRKPRDEIPKYISCADVCIDSFPNEPYYAAAHPIKLLEYGACEKPVVATNVEETAKIIIHGKYGFLADPSNPKEYASYIIQLLTNPELAVKMGKEFSDYVKNNFNWDYLAQKTENILT